MTRVGSLRLKLRQSAVFSSLAPAFESSALIDRRDLASAAAVTAAALAVYAATLPPSITFEDSGELVTAAATLGIPHAPGYPLYTLLAHLFAAWPLGDVTATAWRVNLFSAVVAALGVGALTLVLRAIGLSRPAAAAGGLAAGFSRTLWSQAIVAEVYSLGFLLLGLVLLALTWFDRRRDLTSLLVVGILCGLSLTNHYLFVLCVPAIALHLIWRGPYLLRRPRWLGAAALAVAIGFLPFLYLPLRSAMDPLLDWGNPESWENFWYMVRRSQFAEVENAAGVQLPERLRHLRDIGVSLAFIELTPLSAPLMLIGLLRLHRRNRVWARSTLLMMVGSTVGLVLLVGFHYDPSRAFVIRVYTIQAYVVASIWAAAGFDAVVCALRRWSPSAALAIAIALPVAVGAAHFKTNSLGRDDLARRHASALMATLPKDAVLLGVRDDADLFPLLYAQAVEGERPDVTVLDDFGLVFNRWQGRPLIDRIVRTNSELTAYRKRLQAIAAESGRPVFYIQPPDDDRKQMQPFGILYQKRGSAAESAPPEFERLYADILRLAPDEVTNYMGRFVAGKYQLRHGLALAAAGRDEEADAAFSRASVFGRRHIELLVNLNSDLNRIGRFDRGSDSLAELERLAPYRRRALNRDHYFSRMEYYQAHGDLDGMTQELRALRRIAPGLAEARDWLARVLFDRGRTRCHASHWADALSDFQEARALGYDAPWAGSLVGVCLVQTGRIEEGLGELRRAVAARPGEKGIRGNLVAMLRRLGRDDEARGAEHDSHNGR